MTDGKLIQALQTFSADEWQEMEAILARQNSSRPFDLLRVLRPLLTSNKDTEKQTLYAALYPGEVYNDQRLREDIFLLYKQVKQFLMGLELEQRAELQQQLLLPQLRKRGLLKDLRSQLDRTEQRLKQKQERDEGVYLEAFYLAEEGDQVFGLKQVRTYDANLQNKVDNLDRFYLVKKLKESCEILNRRNIISAAYTVHLEDEMLGIIEKGYPHLDLPIIQVYYHIYKSLTHPEAEGHYKELVSLLQQQYNQFPLEEARNMYRYAQNYCIRKINQGQRQYFQELYELYVQLLENGVILQNGELDHTDYKNIATVALRVGQSQWTYQFLEQYKDRLPASYKEAAYKLNLASYFYDIEAYDKASDLLINARFDDIFYSLSARHLLLKVFYDQEEFEAFTYQLESFKVYLARNKQISTANKQSNLNFLKVCRRLGALKQSFSYIADKEITKRVKGIEGIIAKYNPLANKVWLQQKLGEIKKEQNSLNL